MGGGGPDKTPPVVSLTAPANNSIFTIGDRITVSANATDNVGVKKVEFFANGSLLGSDTKSPYSITWNSSDNNYKNGINFLNNNLMWMLGDCSAGGATLFAQPAGAKRNPKTGAGGNPICPAIEPTFMYPNLPTGWVYTDDRKNLDGDVDVTYTGTAITIPGFCSPFGSLKCNLGTITLSAKAYDEANNVGQASSRTITLNP